MYRCRGDDDGDVAGGSGCGGGGCDCSGDSGGLVTHVSGLGGCGGGDGA